jgi:hypothetical protein
VDRARLEVHGLSLEAPDRSVVRERDEDAGGRRSRLAVSRTIPVGAAPLAVLPRPAPPRYLIRLTTAGERLLGEARPAFRDYAEAVEGRLGKTRVAALRTALEELRKAVGDELESRRL